MTLAEIRELVRTVQIQKTHTPRVFLVKGMTENELLAILLLAQSQLCELENRATKETLNPS